jgi:hypothetical protein
MIMRMRRVAPLMLSAPVALALWGVVLVAVTLFQPAGRPVAVFAPGGPEAALAAVIAADGAILEIRSAAVIAVSKEPDFVRRLYREGPVLVIIARGVGCGFGVGFGPSRRTVA